MASVKCPICGREVPDGAKTFPFCDERCRLLDLGNWLDERYAVARPLLGEDDSTPPDADDPTGRLN